MNTFSPGNMPVAPDLLASVPVHVVALFDFSDWQATHPTEPLPGVQVDACFAQSNDALNNVMDRLAMIQRDDGALVNEIVTLDALHPEVMDALVDYVNQAGDSAANAAAAEAAAIAAQAAADAAAASAAAADTSAQQGAADSAASAADAAADAAAADASADAAAASEATIAAIMPPMPSVPGNIIEVDATGNAYQFTTGILVGAGPFFDARGLPIKNGASAVDGTDFATRADVEGMISGSGAVPAPIAGDEDKVLTALAPGIFGWRFFLADMISDATAYMKGLLTTIDDALDFRTAIDVPSNAEVAAAIAAGDAAKQPLDPMLTALANLVTAANQLAYFTGPDAVALTNLSAFMRTVLDDVDEVAARATLGAAGLGANNYTGKQTVTVATNDPFELQATAADPTLALYQAKATAGAVNDELFNIYFYGKDSANAKALFAFIDAILMDPTAASKDGQIRLNPIVNNVPVTALGAANGVVVGAPTGSFMGTGTINATGIYVNGVSATPIGTQTKYIAANEWMPNITNGPKRAVAQSVTNLLMEDVLVFDGAVNQSATFDWMPPKQWDGGAIFFTFIWQAAVGTVAQTCIMTLAGVAVGNNETPDAAPGTGVSVSDGLDALNVQLISGGSTGVTVAGTPADNERIRLRLTRAAATDTLTGNISFIGMNLFYGTNAGNDN